MHKWKRDEYQQIDEIPKELIPHLLIPLREALKIQKIESAPEIIPEYVAHVAIPVYEKLQRARREINPVTIMFNIDSAPISIFGFDCVYTFQVVR